MGRLNCMFSGSILIQIQDPDCVLFPLVKTHKYVKVLNDVYVEILRFFPQSIFYISENGLNHNDQNVAAEFMGVNVVVRC